jgi:hypothetical protein
MTMARDTKKARATSDEPAASSRMTDGAQDRPVPEPVAVSENELDRWLQLLAWTGQAGAWWAAAGMPDPGPSEAATGTHRVADGRESDVRLSADGRVVLVEHKVGDHFRPAQAAGYRAEIDRYRQLGVEAAAIVVAPQAHLQRLPAAEMASFDGSLALEDAAESLTASDAPTRRIADRLRAAGAPVVARPDDPVTVEFGNGYRAALADLASPLSIGPRSLSKKGAGFANFNKPPGASQLWHHLSNTRRGGVGTVTLSVKAENWRPGLQPPRNAEVIGPAERPDANDYYVIYEVPPMDKARPVGEQLDALIEAVGAAEVLRDWWLSVAE